MSASALYEGWVAHHRREPATHGFRYRVLFALLDVDDLPQALERHPLWSARRPAPVRFRRSDYLGDPDTPLAEAARDLVAQRTGRRPEGPVRLLTTPRFLGVGFNPVSFYYLYGADGTRLEAVIAEVTNTPWGERHAYVLVSDGQARGGELRGRFAKRLHVSPFMPMEQSYRLAVAPPDARLRLTITSEQAGRTVFSAGLDLRRRPLSRREMTRAMLVHPPSGVATLARIYWNALRLRLKGVSYFPPPARGRADPPSGGATRACAPSPRTSAARAPAPRAGSAPTSARRSRCPLSARG